MSTRQFAGPKARNGTGNLEGLDRRCCGRGAVREQEEVEFPLSGTTHHGLFNGKAMVCTENVSEARDIDAGEVRSLEAN